MKKAHLISAALCLSLLTGCMRFTVPVLPEGSPPPEPQETVQLEQVTANELVARLLLSEQGQKPGENVILSPLSIEMALGMAMNGADGQAKEDMETLLGMDAGKFNALLGSYMERADETLSIANSVWLNKSMEGMVNDYFKNTMTERYRAQQGLFTPYSQQDAGTINGWVKEKTHGKIDSIVAPGDLTDKTLAVLINALYFNGKWTEPFEDYQVSKGKFRAQDGDQDAELMSDRVETYFESDGFTGFSKTYGDGYEFIGILPEQEGDVDLSALDLDAFLDSETGAYDVDIKIPKFELEYANSLVNTLESLGLGSLFEQGGMDAMLTDAAKAGGAEAHVSDVVHKTYMKMYEQGTEAAAVTAVMVKATCTMIPVEREVKEVFLDRPFAFFIRDAFGQIVFCGAIHSVE